MKNSIIMQRSQRYTGIQLDQNSPKDCYFFS